jgi:organic hydroperoxide reductase OsmC/OhrA
MPAKLPHHYTATVTRTARSRATLRAEGRPPIAAAPPPEFDGPPDLWSPEHLLLASLGLCLETTFDALAARDKLDVARWDATVEATLDRTPAGAELGGFRISVEIEVAPGDVARAQDVLARARRQCFVSHALRAPVEVAATVRAAPVAA